MNKNFIKKLNLNKGAYLSPMAGVTDTSMRVLCAEHSAIYTVSEMVSAKALTMQDKKSVLLMRGGGGKAPFGIQIFGNEPEVMAEATKLICSGKYNIDFDFIDINMGCPAPKITGSGAGSALMKTPKIAAEIAKQCVKSADEYGVPVTVKTRIGWDNIEGTYTAVEIAKMCEDAGVAVITVHGRTRSEMYTPGVHRDVIASVKSAVNIPVIANGDVQDAQSALSMLKETNCDSLAIGRAAMGNPWIFEEVACAMQGKPLPKPPELKERLATMRAHIYDMCEKKGEFVAMQQSRSQAAYYMHGLKGAAALRRACCGLSNFSDIDNIIEMAFEQNT